MVQLCPQDKVWFQYQSVPVMRRSTAPSLRKFVSLPDGSTEYVPRFNAPFVPHASRDTASILELVLDPAPEACFVNTKLTWDTPTSACQDVSSTGKKDTPTSAFPDSSSTSVPDNYSTSTRLNELSSNYIEYKGKTRSI
uniref:Uncharacterized protein n=1 Tax=Timema cristinae TaxID=61476 RepID=A0A7R9H5E3_TIMCR|nr:unnamed protein product [Timema cristinae]